MSIDYRAGLACLLVLAGCNSQPKGQVIARVNGDDITQQELSTIMEGQPQPANKTVAQNTALDQLVSQRLFVQAAKDDKLDKTPEYLAASRRSDDAILVQMLASSIVGSLRTPFGSDLDKFIAANPSRFAGRELIALDQIRAPIAVANQPWLKAANSLPEVAKALQARQIAFETSRNVVDSATMVPGLMDTLNRLPPGQPFAVPAGASTIISAIIGRKPASLSGDEARRAAAEIMRGQSSQQALQTRLAALRKSAKIEYQPGFGPAPAKPAPKP